MQDCGNYNNMIGKNNPLIRFLKKHWGVFFVLVIWMAFSYPYFFQGKVPYPSTYQVNHFKPWSMYEKYWGPVKNGAMPDIIDQIYPWRHFSISSWMQGEIPLWNPNNFAGNPHIGNFQSAAFSPVNLLFFILPFVDAWSIAILLQSLFAGVWLYLFLRETKISMSAACIGAISFMFCGFMVVWMGYGTLGFAVAFLPLALYAVEKYSNTKKIRYLPLLSFSVAASLFSGHFQTSLYVMLFSFLYTVYKGFSLGPTWGLRLLLAFFIGGVISLIQLLPSMQLYTYSQRSESFNTGGGIPFWYLITAIVPDFFGNPVTRNDWAGFYAEWASFVGIIPLTLALFVSQKKQKNVIFFIIAALVSLLFALDTAFQGFIGQLKIPVLSTSYPARAIVLWSFSLAVLSGFGFEQLTRFVAEKNKKSIITRFVLIGSIVLVVWLLIMFGKVLPMDKLAIAKRNLILPTAMFGLFSISILSLLFLKVRYKLLIITAIVLTLTSFDSLRFVTKWMPFDPKSFVFADTSVIQAMKKNIGYGRVYGNLGAVETYYDLPSIEGYDPLYIQRHGEVVSSAFDGTFRQAERSVVQLNRNGIYVDRVLDLLGVSLIFHPIADTNQTWAYPVWDKSKKYSRIYKDDKFELYRNNTVLPRATLFYKYEVIPDAKKTIERFYTEAFDFRHIVLLEEKPSLSEEQINSGSGKAVITLYKPNKIVIQATSSKPAFLFLSDTFYPTWKVSVNGQQKKIYIADHAYRAVEVPQGEAEVIFTNSF